MLKIDVKGNMQEKSRFLLALGLAIIIMLAVLPIAIFAADSGEGYGQLFIEYYDEDDQYQDIVITLDTTGDAAQDYGWSWDRDLNTLTLTNGNIFNIGFDDSYASALDATDTVKLTYAGDITFNTGGVYSDGFNLVVQGNGKAGDKLTLSYLETYDANLLVENANISIETLDPDGSYWYEEMAVYADYDFNLSIVDSTVKFWGSDDYDGFGDYLYSSGDLTITDSDIYVYGLGSSINFDSKLTVNGRSTIFSEGYMYGYGDMIFDLAPGGRVEVHDYSNESAIYTYTDDINPNAIELGLGVEFIQPVAGYIDFSEGYTSFYTEDGDLAIYVILANNTAVVDEVTVDPLSSSVEPGDTVQFTASVTGINDPSEEVTWSVAGNTSSGTYIDDSGLLVIGGDEGEGILAIIATSNENKGVFGSAEVIVTIPTSGSTDPDPEDPAGSGDPEEPGEPEESGDPRDKGNPQTSDNGLLMGGLALLLAVFAIVVVSTRKEKAKVRVKAKDE